MFFPVMVIVNRFHFQRSLFLLLFRFVFLNLVCYFSSFSFLCVAIFLLCFSFVHRGFSLFFFLCPISHFFFCVVWVWHCIILFSFCGYYYYYYYWYYWYYWYRDVREHDQSNHSGKGSYQYYPTPSGLVLLERTAIPR